MDIGKRIKLIRVGVFCLPPGFFARLIGIGKDELEDIEAEKRIPSDEALERISILTKTTRGWYQTGCKPATVKNWGYFELPFPGIETLGKRQEEIISEIDRTWRREGLEAVREMGLKEFFVAELEGGGWRYLVLAHGSSGATIFKVGDVLWDAMRFALEGGGAKEGKRIEVSEKFAEKIGSPRQSHTDPLRVVEFFRLLGLGGIPESWNVDLSEIDFRVWRKEDSRYQPMVRAALELVGGLASSSGGESPYFGCFSRDEIERLRPLAWKKELGLAD